MSFIIIPLVAILVSTLTLFSGFGLGTLLMPAIAFFFPLPLAVAATAVVHFLNNLFKIVLVGKNADRKTVLLFGITAMAGAFLGSYLLLTLSNVAPLGSYVLFGATITIHPVKLVMGILIIVFALFDLIPKLEKIQFAARYLPLGGALSGFFGGLSGMQGALRSAFLAKTNLDKNAFIGTNVMCAVIVDMSRLLVYGIGFYTKDFVKIPQSMWSIVIITTIAAFIGSFTGKKLVKKVTIREVQMIVGIMLLVVGVGLTSGIF